MYALVLLLAPMAAEQPQQPAYYVKVDFVVINRVRTFNVEYDNWGRPRFVPQETVWISFWDRLRVTVLPVPQAIVARGWWTMSNLRSMTRCTEGWLLESNDNINVIAPEVRIINSSFDWEMRHRRIFRPIRRP
jgi:hypothetical protein